MAYVYSTGFSVLLGGSLEAQIICARSPAEGCLVPTAVAYQVPPAGSKYMHAQCMGQHIQLRRNMYTSRSTGSTRT
jgi:hypothetical protein